MSPRLAAASFLVCLVAGCGGSPAATDGGVDMGGDASTADAGHDAGPPPAELYGPCTSDAECPGAGAVCRRNTTGWPGGFCTVPCTDRTPCDDGLSYNHCLDDGTGHSFCERRCLNGVDCSRDGYTCEGDYPPAGGRCIPVCGTDADCGDGAVCQHETAHCVAPGTPPPSGADVGAACAAGADCRSGQCTPEVRTTGATGYVHGMCFGQCAIPPGYNSTNFFADSDLPQGSCTTGQVCFPATNNLARGDLGVCLPGCTSNADCRTADDYTCLKTIQGKTFGVGICQPADCTRPATPCPSGYVCHPTSRGGYCATM